MIIKSYSMALGWRIEREQMTSWANAHKGIPVAGLLQGNPPGSASGPLSYANLYRSTG